MGQVTEAPVGPYVVATAWQCSSCEVEGRHLDQTEVTCWNCGGQVTVTARPSIRVDDL
jgi:hypothetical protein